VAHALKLAATLPKDKVVLINLSGRGDKDLDEAVRLLDLKAKHGTCAGAH
jgi:tryptophan synthase beta subunit